MGCGCNNNFSGDNEPLTNIPFDRGDKSNINLDMGNPIAGGSVPTRGNGLRKKQCTCGRNAGGACQCKQNLQQRIKSNKAKFSSFMGTSQNFPKVDTKKYGISDEHYYEFNSPSNVRTGINYNDIDVSF